MDGLFNVFYFFTTIMGLMMFKNLLTFLVITVGLQACGTIVFHPPVHELGANKVPDVAVSGQIQFANKQESVEPVILHSYGGTSLQSNYNEVTKTLVTQATSELARHGKNAKQGSDKVIGLKVTNLNSRYIAFFWKGTMTFTVMLGDAAPFEITVNHGTGAGAQQDLSGSIADGVVALFQDSRVQEYLRK